MADTNVVAAAVSVAGGALVVGIGYLVRFRRATYLVSGYRPDRVDDEEQVVRVVGWFAILVGVVTASLGVGMAVVPLRESTWGVVWLTYSALLLLGVVALNVLGRR